MIELYTCLYLGRKHGLGGAELKPRTGHGRGIWGQAAHVSKFMSITLAALRRVAKNYIFSCPNRKPINPKKAKDVKLQ